MQRMLCLFALSLCLAGGACADDVVSRSLAFRKGRQFDELSRPRFRSRQTHLGWEIRTPTATILATESRAEAEQAASRFEDAWQRLIGFSETWTKIHKKPQFGRGTIQVVVDHRPFRGSQSPPTLQILGQEAVMVYLNTNAPGDTLARQGKRLDMATAKAFFVISGLSKQLPDWVQNGIAGFLARPVEAASASDKINNAKAPMPPSVGIGSRSGQALFEPPANPRKLRRWTVPPDQLLAQEESQRRVRFFLEGDDGRNAIAFLRLLAASSAGQAVAWNQFVDRTRDSFATWKKDPGSKPWQLDKSKPVPPALRTTLDEMLFFLKLSDRAGRGFAGVRPKVLESGPNGFRQVDVMANKPQRRRVADVLRRLDRDGLWATVLPGGKTLLSTQRERVREIARVGAAYVLSEAGDRREILLGLPNGGQLVAWIDGKRDGATAVVKFEVRDAAGKPVKEDSRPNRKGRSETTPEVPAGQVPGR